MPALRLATFNVLFGHRGDGWDSWSERRPLFRRAIERARPDILGLQEVFPSQLEGLAEALGEFALVPGPCSGRARWFDVSLPAGLVLRAARTLHLPPRSDLAQARSERMNTGEHQPIAYLPGRFRPLESGAFWISSSPERPGSMLPLALSPFLVHWVRFERLDGSGTLLVFNAHFGHAPWHHGATARTVAMQIEAAVAASPGMPAAAPGQDRSSVFLIGDFNAWPSSPLIRMLTSASGAGLVDAARMAPERVGPPVTFHWGVGAARLGLTLDYVLARGAPRARRAEVIDVHEGRSYPSDHYPLVVEFEAGEPSSPSAQARGQPASVVRPTPILHP